MLGYDPFRIPKEELFLAAAIFAGAILAIGWLRRELDFTPLLRNRRLLLLLGAILAWTLLTTLTSTNRTLSWQAFGLFVASVVLFVGFYLAATKLPIAAASVVFAAGVPNAVVLLLQLSKVWNFIDPGGDQAAVMGRRYGLTGLLGNANDAGVYLLANVLIAVAFALEMRGALRVVGFAIAALLSAGMVATLTLTSIIAGAIAIGVLIVVHWMGDHFRWRLIFAALGIVIVLGGIALATPPVQSRVRDIVRTGNFSYALTGRPIAYIAAWRMFLQHPIVGVGPGCFKYQFFDERIRIARDYPKMAELIPQNFGEAHNDHLQVLAESGVIGYALFLAANSFVASISFRRPPHHDPRARLARTIALPAVVGLFVAALAQFPMELAATRITYLFTYALCLNWSMRWSDAS